MLNLNSILLFSEKPETLIEFYKKILNREPSWSGGEFAGFVLGYGMLIIGPHNKVKGPNANPERIIFNFETKNVEVEFKKMHALGAKIIQKPYHPSEEKSMTIATLADPDGNYFQLATPMKES